MVIGPMETVALKKQLREAFASDSSHLVRIHHSAAA
jgi:hypothetical protein